MRREKYSAGRHSDGAQLMVAKVAHSANTVTLSAVDSGENEGDEEDAKMRKRKETKSQE